MNLFKRWFGQRKASAVQSLLYNMSLGGATWTPRKYKLMADEGYKKNVIAYRSVNEIATGAAQAPWLLYRKDANGSKMELTSHALLDLMRRPNPGQGGAAYIEAVTAFYLLAGNTYLEFVAPNGKPPMEMYTLRPDRTSVIKSESGPGGFQYEVNGSKKKWTGDEAQNVLHLKTFNPLDDWYGMSPLDAAAYSADLHTATLEWNKALLDNRAQPSGAVVYAPKEGPATLDDDQYNRLKKQIDEQYAGAKNAGRPMLLEGGLDWRQMGLSPQDMDYINSKNTSARDIALAYGVPPMLLGIPGDNTYSNQKEARLALWEQTILPWLYKLRDELNNSLAPRFGEDLYLDVDEDSISALSPRREAIWDKVQSADFLTFNEKRKAVGYEPIKGGDQVLAPATMLPIGFAVDEQEKDFVDWLVQEQGYSPTKAAAMAKMAFEEK